MSQAVLTSRRAADPITLFVLLSSISIVAFFVLAAGEPLTFADAVLASVIVLALLFSSIRFVRGSLDRFPFLPYALLHFSVFYALPTLWPTLAIRAFPSYQPYYTLALLVSILCVAAIVAGHTVSSIWLRRPADKLARLLPDLSKSTQAAPEVVFALVVIATISKGLSNLAIGTDFLGPVSFLVTTAFDPYFLFAILFYLGYKNQRRRMKLYIVVAFMVLLVFGIFVAQIHAILKPFIIVFLGRFVIRRKIVWSFVLLAILAFLILNPIKNEYRRILRTGPDVSVSVVFDAWKSAWSDESDGGPNLVNIATQSRLNELAYVANALQVIPERVDYQYGYPWRTMVQLYVPGFVWPDKPDLRRAYSTEWAVQMSYIEPFQHKKLAVNLPLPVDGYWNFGVFGVALVGFVFGVVIGFLEILTRKRNCITFALGMALFVAIHANNRLGISIADIPVKILMACLVVTGMNLLTGIAKVVKMPGRNAG